MTWFKILFFIIYKHNKNLKNLNNKINTNVTKRF